jgi:MFS family permease
MESKGEGTPLLPAATRRHDRVLLAVAVTSTFAGLYMSMSIINPYFPDSGPGLLVGDQVVGWVYAANPLGVLAATSLPSLLTERAAFQPAALMVVGLAVACVANLSFGVLGIIIETQAAMITALIACRLLSGAGGAIASAGAFSLVVLEYP